MDEAYLFMGAYDPQHQDTYMRFQKYGYILVFREHRINLTGKKKGNVDVDIVFHIMRDLYEDRDYDKVVLVSGDGDYFRMVEYLSKIGKLEKILLPSHKNASLLYKRLSDEYRVYLDSPSARVKFGLK